MLAGHGATATLRDGNLEVRWPGVFGPNRYVIFAVYAGTAEGYGDVINHVVTQETSYKAPCAKLLNSLFLTVQAVDANGLSEVYQAELKL
ncbi:hypothetical protein BaRGS_00025652 [Batillaria attramentaria]|uniref:Uncharacterized protein n=1 Tax=Batillaria attramentaria TaxID=370345 RepID=A0ABD0K6W8_9CAEN